MNLTTGIDEFLASLASERGLSPNTVSAYRRDLRQYAAFLDGGEPTPKRTSAFVAALHADGLVSSTIARKVAAVRGLHRFLIAEGLSEHDPTVLLDSPQRPRALPKALSYDEVEKLLQAPDPSDPLGRRDRALLEFLYATGARVSEAVSVELIDLELEGRTVLLTGKGSRQRVVPVGGHAVDAIRSYSAGSHDASQGSGSGRRLFLNARGWPPQPPGHV